MVFKVINPMISEGEIIGYEIANETGAVKKIKLEDVFKIVEKSNSNCKVVTDEQGNKHLVFKELDQQPNDINYTIECRIVQDEKLIGYKCRSSSGELVKFKPSKLWELAATGCITNAEAQVVNNTITLVGKGIHLREIETSNG